MAVEAKLGLVPAKTKDSGSKKDCWFQQKSKAMEAKLVLVTAKTKDSGNKKDCWFQQKLKAVVAKLGWSAKPR